MRASAREGAAAELPTAKGGSAAVRKGRSAASKPIAVSELVPVNGEAEVYAALDALGISTSKAERIPILRRAVREFLGHYADARSGPYALYPRTVSHAVTRINVGWHRAGGSTRSSSGYQEPDRITKPVGYLATLLTEQACELPNCELGIFLDTDEECATCNYRRNARINDIKAAEALEQQRREQEWCQQQHDLARRAAVDRDHGHALDENARRDQSAAAKAAEAAETTRAREVMAAEFAALDAAAAGRPIVPAQLHRAHDQEPADEDEPDFGGFPNENQAPEDTDEAWQIASGPSMEYRVWKEQQAAAREQRDAAKLAALTIRTA
ncbi:hypothetical protein ACWGIU_14125 [Streptomyces sp. NPDC054840]